VFLAFSYGSFVGFWGAHYAAEKLGLLTAGRRQHDDGGPRRQIVDTRRDGGLLHADVRAPHGPGGAALGIDLAAGPVRRLILSGEPAGSIPETKALIERQWGRQGRRHRGHDRGGDDRDVRV
jgi:phenylacetate-CoA ligase